MEEKEKLARLRREFSELDAPSHRARPPQEIWVAAPDGARLRTVVTLPEGEGPFPTILLRSCYPQAEPEYQLAAQGYAQRGFAFVYQFCRGTGGSEGAWEPNIHEREDGLAAARWLAAQPFAGPCGYLGCSYLAFTGWIMADALPDKFKTLYLTHYGTDRFASAYQNGLFRHDILTGWAMDNAGFPVKADYLASCRHRPQLTVDEDLWGGRLGWYRDWITHADPHDPYWNEGLWGQLRDIPSRLALPVYIGSGWYDHHLGSTVRTYLALPPPTRAKSVLRIGAWNHNFEPCADGKPQRHLENSDTASAFRWFRRLLIQGEVPKGGVELYNIGADRWEHFDGLPGAGAKTRELFLSCPDRSLTPRAPQRQAPLRYRYDPDDPVPSHGGDSLFTTRQEVGSLPQPAPGWRPDVLSFVSEPLAAPLHLCGEITAELEVASDCPDTAFTAKLMEVAPDGTARNIRGGAATLAYRDAGDAEQPYRPGQRVRATIRMWLVSWTVPAGCRLRLDVSSSNFPEYAAHPNRAGAWARQTGADVARQTLFGGRLLLPLGEEREDPPT